MQPHPIGVLIATILMILGTVKLLEIVFYFTDKHRKRKGENK